MPKKEDKPKGQKNRAPPPKAAEKKSASKEQESAESKRRREAREKRLESQWFAFWTEVEDFARDESLNPYAIGIMSMKGTKTETKESISRKTALWSFDLQSKIYLVLNGVSTKWPFANSVQGDMATKYVMKTYVPPKSSIIEWKWPDFKPIDVHNAFRRFDRAADILQRVWTKLSTGSSGCKMSWGKAVMVITTGESRWFFEKNIPMIILSKVDADELHILIGRYQDDKRNWDKKIRPELEEASKKALVKSVKDVRAKFKKVKENKSKMTQWEIDALDAMKAFEDIFTRFCSQNKMK